METMDENDRSPQSPAGDSADAVAPSRLSRIDTPWTIVARAHDGPCDAAASAQRLLIERYRGAAYRYLRASVRDPDAAAELFQEFALRLLRGDFHRARRHRGRFRDYLKSVLVNL